MKILVIGDSCKDVFIYGTVDKLCPDAPVPVLIPHHQTESGGMAANVYENIESLGVDVDIITNSKVITKVRYIEEKTNHQIIRVDSEQSKIPRIKNISQIPFQQYDAIVISDYNKGFLEYDDIKYITKQHSVVFIDTKKIINNKMQNARFIKINETEYKANVHAGQMFETFENQLIITLGGNGCRFKDKHYKVDKVEIKDNSGAGDTFMSALVVEYCNSQDIDKAIDYANQCATIVVQHKGITKIGYTKSINK
jgi:bifunctional ADP-heptose synthase (sugar kinase/adenylyltransferase)